MWPRFGKSSSGTHPPTITRWSRNAPSTFVTSMRTARLAVVWSNCAMLPLRFALRRSVQAAAQVVFKDSLGGLFAAARRPLQIEIGLQGRGHRRFTLSVLAKSEDRAIERPPQVKSRPRFYALSAVVLRQLIQQQRVEPSVF